MTRPDDRDERFVESLMQELPMSMNESPEMQNELKQMAARKSPKPSGRTTYGLGFGATAAVATLAIFVLGTRPSAAKTWEEVQDAVETVSTFWLKGSVDSEHQQLEFDIRFDGDEALIQPGDGTMVYFSEDEMMMLESGGTEVKVVPVPEEVRDVVKSGFQQFDIGDMMAGWESEFGKKNMTMSEPYMFDGREVVDVRMDEPNGDGRVEMIVDTATKIPMSVRANGEDGETIELTMRVNQGVDEIEPVWPSGVTFKEIDPSEIDQMDFGFDEDRDAEVQVEIEVNE